MKINKVTCQESSAKLDTKKLTSAQNHLLIKANLLSLDFNGLIRTRAHPDKTLLHTYTQTMAIAHYVIPKKIL